MEKSITFWELVRFGEANGGNMVNGMPWSFTYEGCPVTHENDRLYLINLPGGETIRFAPGDLLLGSNKNLRLEKGNGS